MRLIGLTGRSGSGKSTVGSIASEIGITVFDCDAIYREMTSKPTACLDAIRDAFGDETVRDGALYRPALREKVFSDPLLLQELNSITARFMAQEIKIRMRAIDAPMVILDAPTLFESGFDVFCDRILCVIASDETCIQRITKRDGIDESAARIRLTQQHSQAFFVEQCDIILYNEGDEAEFRKEALAVLLALQKGEI